MIQSESEAPPTVSHGTRDAQGVITVTEYRDDARNFFEAYGWALVEATMVSRRNGEDLSF